MPDELSERGLPFGAEVEAGGVGFRVFAEGRRRVEVAIEGGPGGLAGRSFALAAEGDGFHAGRVAGVGAGTRYRYRLEPGGALFPDPASRSQPDGPHGASEVVDPRAFRWTDGAWRGRALRGLVLYELHVGTFTPEGTFAAAARELERLAALGVNAVELMPVAEFPGRFGWGYDGVDLFAPARAYGRPDDLRALVDRAHALGLAVLLDVVYNHLGPDGNYLRAFAPRFFSSRRAGEWGEPPDFDGPGAPFARALVLANAAYWVEEFHLDGLRLDATQGLFDDSAEPIVAAIARRAREAAPHRRVLVIGENEPQDASLARPVEAGGAGLDALWSDDFHHAAVVALTGRREAYFTDYRGAPQELVSAARRGFLFQGQRYRWQQKRRGTPALDLAPERFVHFLENHDQVANAAGGRRLRALTSAGRLRAMTVALLLGPATPLLFQGQEYGAPQPFRYFADHAGDLARCVREGRARFERQFPGAVALETAGGALADPVDPRTFEASRLDPRDRETAEAAAWLALHRDLLALRRDDTVFAAQRAPEGAVLGDEAFALRFAGEGGDDRLLLVNLGRDLELDPCPEPLLAPPAGRAWREALSSEDPRYGGTGAPSPAGEDGGFRLAGHAASVLAAAIEGGKP
jgi:maltooligosyltrehalose trehalohydrolase